MNNEPIGWIIEPVRPPYQPYLTINPDVADKREKKGDIVTPYFRKREDEGDEL